MPATMGRACWGAATLGAFGIGVAVATAAPASAAPLDSADRGGSHSPAARHTPASTRASAVVRPAAAAARTSSARAARPVAAPKTPATVADTVVAPVSRRAAVTPSATAAAEVTPTDIWDSLMTRLAGIFGWDPRGRLVTVYKGTHFVVPSIRTALWITSDSGDATFTDNSKYDLKDEDQHDWNKLSGLTFTPWEPNRNAAMVVWRLNDVNDPYFEVGPFFNDNYAYVFPDENQIIHVPVGETFSYYVDYTGITITYGTTTVYKAYPSDLIPNFWTSARVTGWFGGSEVAPNTVSYYKHVY